MSKAAKYSAAFLSLVGFIIILFFTERHQHVRLLGVYSLLFLIYLYLLRNLKEMRTHEILYFGILLRIFAVVSFPALSDDFYRFIWDGRILNAGYNPFEYLPHQFLEMHISENVNAELYSLLNSPDYFTVYPPLVQGIFLLATGIFPNDIYGSMLVMKVAAFFAEIGLLVVMIRILRRLNFSTRYVAVYALNPLVILEVTGNLHHEGIMLFFLCTAVYLLMKSKYVSSAVFWGIAVATKLLPLLYLPLLLRRLRVKNLVQYFLIITLVLFLLFLPLIDGLITGMGESISLYFQKFEFNASIYYIIREVGFELKGYNIIQSVGPYLALTVFILVMIYSLLAPETKNIFKGMIWIFIIYLAFSTTVHPWYIISLVAFSLFTGYLFPIVWSFFVFLTYLGYTRTGYTEPGWVVVMEYLTVYGVMGYEIFARKSNPLLFKFIKLKNTLTKPAAV